MLQLVPDEIETVGAAGETKASVSVRIRTVGVVGELVDSKCHRGVMKPEEGRCPATARSAAGLVPFRQ